MNTLPTPDSLKIKRLISLDVFRGFTVFLMIIVNSSDSMSAYSWLRHREWDGCTSADIVFPFFIFIVGISSVLNLHNQQKKGLQRRDLLLEILRRSVILFGIGLLLNAFPSHFQWSNLRLMGVLQRVAICYAVVSYLYLSTRVSTQLLIACLILVIYCLLMTQFPAPGYNANPLSLEGNLAGFIDRYIMTSDHLYYQDFDPEGLFSTLSAIATALLGNLTGAWLLSSQKTNYTHQVMMIAGLILSISGWIWGLSFPINKALWSSSYVLWTAGLALLVFGVVYWLVELKRHIKWIVPFQIFGSNALAAFVLHVLSLKIQAAIVISFSQHPIADARSVISSGLFDGLSPENASLLYAVSHAAIWLLILAYVDRGRYQPLRQI